ncbi:hypothetical protein GCM10008986_24500 [Salinibacillus aidingensis]|uniref:Uncharacterized protein n=1 Tax=Salinibacillus aidingensis TaxID=237684 RepID=A0ABN1BFB1_9BACI
MLTPTFDLEPVKRDKSFCVEYVYKSIFLMPDKGEKPIEFKSKTCFNGHSYE